MATNRSAGQSHPLSRFESLPVEVLLKVAKESGNPWLPYSSPFLYGLLESDETFRNKQRKEIFDRAFKTFGSVSRKGRPSKTPTALDYAQVFGDIVQLPWFASKVFTSFNKRRATQWISPGALRRWAMSVHGAWALFNQPKWTQALGDFVKVILSVWPEVAHHTEPARFAYHKGVLTTLTQGSAIGIRFLTGMKLHASDIEPEEIYDNDPEFPQGRWIKRWKSGNSKVASLGKDHWEVHHMRHAIAAMRLTRIPKLSHRYARSIRAYLAWFWTPAKIKRISGSRFDSPDCFLDLCAILRNWNQVEQLDSEDAEVVQEWAIRHQIGSELDKYHARQQLYTQYSTAASDKLDKYYELHRAFEIVAKWRKKIEEMSASADPALEEIEACKAKLAGHKKAFEAALLGVKALHKRLHKAGQLVALIA